MSKLFKISFVLTIALRAVLADAQVDSLQNRITINGTIRDDMDLPISNVIIINKQSRTGYFGKVDGTFSIDCNRSDTLAITSLGFHTRNITFTDSAVGQSFHIKLYLETRTYRLASVEVFAQRDLERIQDDIKKLGYNCRSCASQPYHPIACTALNP